MPPRRTGSLADVGQVLERDHVAVIPECFVDDRVRCSVSYVTDTASTPATD
jgi:hypothetical protein